MLNIGQNVFVLNRRNQQKRAIILKRAKTLAIEEEKYLTNISPDLIPRHLIFEEKQNLDKPVKLTIGNLEPNESFEKEMYGKDHVGHHNRWTHVGNILKKPSRVLDLGSGTGNLALHLYKNRNKQIEYLGIEYSENNIQKAVDRLLRKRSQTIPEWIKFQQEDLTVDHSFGTNWDLIVSFETIEHIGVDYAKTLLDTIHRSSNKDTLILISTPIYKHHIGAFSGHIINDEVNEFTYDEMKDLVSEKFEIVEHFGVFANKTDFVKELKDDELSVYNKLSKYYGDGELAWIFAPLVPEFSRNCIWKLKIKTT